MEEINLQDIDPDITVEEYLRKQCDTQIERLKQHTEQLLQQFKSESQEVREKLVYSLQPN